MNKFYIYAYLREDKVSPYYIGKGTAGRCFQNCNRVGTPTPKDKSRIVKVAENLSEEDAFALEKTLILFYGKKIDGGILNNFSDGGRGGNNKFTPASEEHRKKTSIASLRMWQSLSPEERSERNKRGAKKRDWQKYKELPVWQTMVEKKGTSICITNVDTHQTFTYASIREAERDGWNKRQIHLHRDKDTVWRHNKRSKTPGARFIVQSNR